MLQIDDADIFKGLERDNPRWDSKKNSSPFEKFSHKRAYFSKFEMLVRQWEVTVRLR